MHAAIAEADQSTGSLRMLRQPCLILNADYRPLATYPLSIRPVRKAIENVVKLKADIVEEWPGILRTPRTSYPVPKVLVLRTYAPIYGEPKFCRANVFLRDRFRCQYCGEPFETPELTFDHLLPRARGGKTEWTNILTCCIACNGLKGDKPAKHSGRKAVSGSLRPLKLPRQPTAAELMKIGLEFLSPAMKADFGSWLYWTAELRA